MEGVGQEGCSVRAVRVAGGAGGEGVGVRRNAPSERAGQRAACGTEPREHRLGTPRTRPYQGWRLQVGEGWVGGW